MGSVRVVYSDEVPRWADLDELKHSVSQWTHAFMMFWMA
jgi:hypothetical protein